MAWTTKSVLTNMDMSSMLTLPSPIMDATTAELRALGIQLAVKREDCIHPTISGNKWRKLKYNVAHALSSRAQTLITFGGAFSNHIHALAAASHKYGLSSVGIIRGEYDADNPTLAFARKHGMKLHFVDRTAYRSKENSPAVAQIIREYPHPFIIPEGGSNDHALPGLAELADEINETPYDIVMVSAGTGMTAAGILRQLATDKQLWVFSSLKSGHLKEEILSHCTIGREDQLRMMVDYHFGGYGKVPRMLVEEINAYYRETGISVDPIYNGKLLSGFMDMARKSMLDPTKSYLWVHTGGLQGIPAHNYMASKKGRPLLVSR